MGYKVRCERILSALFGKREHFSRKIHARIQRGGGTGGLDSPPPLRFVRGGVLCGCLLAKRGGPNDVFILLL